MTVSNSLTQGNGNKKLTLNQEINTEVFQELIKNTFKDEKRQMRFITRILTAVQATPALKLCDNRSVLIAGLRGESLDLSPEPSMQEYHLIPRKQKKKNPITGEYEETMVAVFQPGVNGRRQLALRSGSYNDIDTRIVRQGEYKGLDKVGRPVFQFIDDEEEALKKPIVGYMAYYEKTNGYIKTKYITMAEAERRAKRSDAFNFELYKKWKSGEKLDWKEQRAVEAPWYKWFDSMAQNAVLKDLLKTTEKSTEQKELEKYEEEWFNSTTISNGFISSQEQAESYFFGEDIQEIQPDEISSESVDEETGEVKTKRGRKKTTEETQAGFFDNED